MLIPLRTDRPPRKAPVITTSLVAINVAVYLFGMLNQATGRFNAESFIEAGHFDPRHFRWWQVISSQFMHDPYSIWHLVFNMIFLWVFGAAVEDRFGRLGFLGFYLIGGTVAALGHAMVSSAPVIGASGAVAAVTGAYLVLFPRSTVATLFLLNMRIIHLPSLWLLGMMISIDLLRQTGACFGMSLGRVAFMAHLAGYAYGALLAFVLLGMKVIPRQECDAFYLFRQWRRRAALRAVTRSAPAAVWDSAAADTGAKLAKRADGTPLNPQEAREAALRSDINRLAPTDLAAAAGTYAELLAIQPDAVFFEPRQIELAAQLFALGHHAHAAQAYELLLKFHPKSDRAGEMRLMLVVLYVRHLANPARARELLAEVRPLLADSRHRSLADTLSAEIPS